MEASDDRTIDLHVTCHQVITVTHIPMSFMTMMLEDSTLLTTPLEKATQDLAMENIKDVVLLWLTRYNGSLHYQQVDYPSNTSHPCLSPSRMSFESLLNTVCRIVFTGLYSQEDDSFQVTYEMNPPTDDLPFISIEGKCRPIFSLPSSNGLKAFQKFNADYHQQNNYTKLSVEWNLLTWMTRHNARIQVRNSFDLRTECPICISPSIDIVVEDIVAHTKKSTKEDDRYSMKLDTTTSPPPIDTSPPSTPVAKASQSTMGPNSNNASTSVTHEYWASSPVIDEYWTKRQFSPTAHVLTRQRKTVLCHALLQSCSAKEQIVYGDRHMPGTPAITKPVMTRMFRPSIPIRNQSTIDSRLFLLDNLSHLRRYFLQSGLEAPRDTWSEWITNNMSEYEDSDPAFMCLIVILMSSATSDQSLSQVIPRLFQSGITSAQGTIEVSTYFGMDVFCSLFAETGRYRVNAERIVNAADYFVQRHKGRIPKDISLTELMTLPGIGHKTGTIILQTAFGRTEGIPSDIHVIRSTKVLNWTESHINDGMECSLNLQSWLPKERWEEINPLFGSLGQLLNKPQTRSKCQEQMESFIVAHSHDKSESKSPANLRHLKYFFLQLIKEYTK